MAALPLTQLLEHRPASWRCCNAASTFCNSTAMLAAFAAKLTACRRIAQSRLLTCRRVRPTCGSGTARPGKRLRRQPRIGAAAPQTGGRSMR